MDRSASANVITELGKSQNKPIHLVSVETSGGTVYMTDCFKLITFGGNDYLPLGYFLGFSDIEETATLQISNITVSLTGIDQTMFSDFLLNNYIDKSLIIYKGFLDSTESLIADPILLFEGRMDQPVLSEDPESGVSTISVTAANTFIDWQRTQYRTTNHENQQIHFPGDMGFEFASEVVDEIFWGRIPK